MARIDKYDPVSGGFRAKLGFAPAANEVGAVIPVVIDGNGLIQKAAANDATAKGVLCLSDRLASGDIADVMTDGEIVDVTTGNVAGAVKGGTVKVGAAGTVSVSGAPTGIYVGHFIEAWRLVVRLGRI